MAEFNPYFFRKRFILVDTTTDPPTEKMNCTCCGTLVTELYENFLFCGECFIRWKQANDLVCERCTREMGKNAESLCKKCRFNRSFMVHEMLM